MILTHVMAKRGADSELFAAALFSVPWNFAESQRMLEEPINKLLFNRHFVHDLHVYYLRHVSYSHAVPLDSSPSCLLVCDCVCVCVLLRLRDLLGTCVLLRALSSSFLPRALATFAFTRTLVYILLHVIFFDTRE